jgi:hypothetical protein
MIMHKTHKLIGRTFLVAAAFLLIIAIANGQEKKSDVLDRVQGNVQKITIQTDKGIVTYEGGEAQALFDRLKSSPEISKVKIISSEGDEEGEPEILMLNPAKIGRNFKFFSNDMKEGKKVKIDVENKNGEKIVTVTTTDKDGKEKTETYKGKEAEEYLEKNEPKDLKKIEWMDKNGKSGNVFYIQESGKDSTNEDINYFIWNDKDSTHTFKYKINDLGKEMKEKIKVTDENGVKKVIITKTDKEGKETTKTLTGEEAEKFLKKHEVNSEDETYENVPVKVIIIKKDKQAEK